MPSGRLSEGEVGDQVRTFFSNPTNSGDNTLQSAPGAGWKWVVYGYQIANNGAGANNVKFRSAANDISSLKALAVAAGSNIPPGTLPLFECNENEILGINLSAATAVGVDYQAAKVRV